MTNAEMRDAVLSKVPAVTLGFWVIKILATTLGETAGDYFSQTLGLGPLRAAELLFAVLLVALTIQLRASRFHPALFWTVLARDGIKIAIYRRTGCQQ